MYDKIITTVVTGLLDDRSICVDSVAALGYSFKGGLFDPPGWEVRGTGWVGNGPIR